MKPRAFLFATLVGCWITGAAHAQVFSVNAVGYVNVRIQPGYNLVANPLIAIDNSIGSLFRNFQGGVVPGTRVFTLVNGSFHSCMWDEFDEQFIGVAAGEETLPGGGVFVYLPGSTEKVLTFVGEIPQGVLCTDIPRGFSIKSDVVPQAISIASADFPSTPGDVIYRLNHNTSAYNSYVFSETERTWIPISPTILVGEAFLLYHPGEATTWCRTFFVNNPF